MSTQWLNRNLDGVRVYVAQFDGEVEVRPVTPSFRNAQIQSCSDRLTKLQRYCVWRLLDYALRDTYGDGVESFNLAQDENGKWRCDKGVYISLSHSGHVVAVAVSKHNVGVDIELAERFAERQHATRKNLAERILCEREIAKYNEENPLLQDQLLLSFWVKKESLFKLDGGRVFVPSSFDTINCDYVNVTQQVVGSSVVYVGIADLLQQPCKVAVLQNFNFDKAEAD